MENVPDDDLEEMIRRRGPGFREMVEQELQARRERKMISDDLLDCEALD